MRLPVLYLLLLLCSTLLCGQKSAYIPLRQVKLKHIPRGENDAMDISTLTPGLYFVQVSAPQAPIHTVRLVVE